MMPSLLVCAIAAPLGFLFWLCGGVTFLAAFAAMVLTTLVVLSAGWASLRALGVPNSSPSAAWVLGVFAISLVLYVLVQWLELRALIAAAPLAAVAGGLAWPGGVCPWRDGPAGGLGAVAALTLLPDAGDYGLRNALFGFDWHVLTRPNAAYGVGIALVSFALLRRWCEERRPRLLAASIALALGLLVFRAHIFLLAAPCVLVAAVMA